MTGAFALSATTLNRVSIDKPDYDRSTLRTGIVHLGVGGFHRAHMARYTHDLLQVEKDTAAWAIAGVGLTSFDQPLCAALQRQDHLYTLIERDADIACANVIGAITASAHVMDSVETALHRIDDAKIVSLTVTENGYCLNAATKRLDLAHEGIARDLAAPQSPQTAIGLIVEGLRRRRAAGDPAFTALSCDNIQHNGDVLRQAALDFATARDAALAHWIAEHGRFPNTMVDRITPRTSQAELDDVAARYGIADACPVYCESFRQWIIEDNFADGRPAWEKVGVQFVDDVTPYELMKLRLLNTSHLAISGLGRLAGYRFVDEAMADARFPAFMSALMERETGRTLAPAPGIDLAAYKRTLIARFANPNIKDTLDRINTDAPVNYLVDPLRDLLATGGPIELLALALAAWIKRVRGFDDAGAPLEVRHPLAAELKRRADEGGPDPLPVLSIDALFGDVGRNPALIAATRRWLASLYDKGALASLDAVLRG
ncbi:MAG: mannitol dehydrogenase family protein [Terricaulis sp.]